MKRIPTFTALVSFFLAIHPASLHAQEQNKFLELSKYIDFKIARDFIPGLAVCIVRPEGIVWSRGFGFQSLEKRLLMSPQSVIGTASVSKLITAIAIMQLHERHQLAVDDPVDKFLPLRIRHPKYPDAEITIAQLLSHTASTSNGPSLWRCYSCDEQPLAREEWIRAYFLPGGRYYHEEGNFFRGRPGEKFVYSNSGYALLAYVVEAVSGLPFNKYCAMNIFAPLGMNNTSFDVAGIQPGTLCTSYSYGYNMDLERDLMDPHVDCKKVVEGDYFFPLCNYTTSTSGAGGMYSSAEQLAHLLVALMNGGRYNGRVILSRKGVAAILSPHVDAGLLPAQFAAFGLGGYAMRLSNGALVWGHTGADPGQSSFLLFNPETNVGAIVLANRFVDIRDLIEWTFAEAIPECCSTSLDQLGDLWRPYEKDRVQRKVTIRVRPNYLPGGSRLYVSGNHRYLGGWVSTGIPLLPQKDRSWERTFLFPDSTSIEFKVTRGGMSKEAVTMDGKTLPNYSLSVTKDTVLQIVVEDWKDQAQ
jgi:CubicO group peptidase (beta-lactamase class C family)